MAAKRLPIKKMITSSKELNLKGAQVFHLPDWNELSHPDRLKIMRQISMSRGRDPRIVNKALAIIKKAKIQPREYEKQAAALLAWVQNPKNIYYINEAGERLQDPIYTLNAKYADCFAEDTLVLRDDFELVKIQDVKVGERIWGRNKWSTVDNFWDKGVLPVTHIKLNNGSVLRLTDDHKVYVKSCEMHGPTCPDFIKHSYNCRNASRKFTWTRIKVADLKEGMRLLQPKEIKRENEVPCEDSEASWLTGAYIAEGWGETTRISISGQDGNWKEETKHRADRYAETRRWNTSIQRKCIAINSREAVAMMADCGSGAINKQIPIEQLQKGDLALLDEGLKLDASINTHGNGWTMNTISPRLAIQYRVLQRMQGRSTSSKLLAEHGGFGDNPIYRIGVRIEGELKEKMLAVKEITRNAETVQCYDIATDDHFVYLPEADCTVSNCDDMVLLLCSLFESIGLPWKYVLSGRNAQGQKVRYIEGETVPPGCTWTHIYCMVGTPPFGTNLWFFCEPTLQKVPLGWDVIDGDSSFLPEMSGRHRGPPMIAQPGKAGINYKPAKIPTGKRRSPAYDLAYGDAYGGSFQPMQAYANSSSIGSSVGSGVAEAAEQDKGKAVYWSQLAIGVFTGVAVSVGTTMVLNWIHGKGLWEGRGTILDRVKTNVAEPLGLIEADEEY